MPSVCDGYVSSGIPSLDKTLKNSLPFGSDTNRQALQEGNAEHTAELGGLEPPTSAGGFERGKVVEIWGAPGCGKTAMA